MKLTSYFPATRWTWIDNLREGEPVSTTAASKLCESYWLPVFYFIKSKVHDSFCAEDLTQDFFCRFLKNNSFAKVDPSKGRLRNYLLKAVNRFLIDYSRKNKNERNTTLISIHDNPGLCFVDEDQNFGISSWDRHWAKNLIGASLDRLEREWKKRGRSYYFECLADHIPWNSGLSQADAATALDVSLPRVRKELFRLRRMYRFFLIEEVRKTVNSEDELHRELEYLRLVFA